MYLEKQNSLGVSDYFKNTAYFGKCQTTVETVVSVFKLFKKITLNNFK